MRAEHAQKIPNLTKNHDMCVHEMPMRGLSTQGQQNEKFFTNPLRTTNSHDNKS